MYDVLTVYVKFRLARMEATKTYRRMPKNIKEHYENLNDSQKFHFENITKVFNESLYDIDPYDYFICGFELYGPKGFSYNRFLHSDVIATYRQKEKSKNLQMRYLVESFKKSYDFMKNYMEKKSYRSSMFIAYCNLYENDMKAPLYHFKISYVNKYFLCWLIECKYLILTNEERSDIQSVMEKYRTYIGELKETKVIPFK